MRLPIRAGNSERATNTGRSVLDEPINALRRHCSASVVGMVAALALGPTASARAATDSKAGDSRLLVVGDSLSAEYGLKRGSGWVALLDARLKEKGLSVQLVNASVSGETTSGGKSRLADLLQRHRPTHVVIELGANDALRGLPLMDTRTNLAAMAQLTRKTGAAVALVGMQVPPNYGGAYARDFAKLFEEVARVEGTALVPFLLEGIANAPSAESLFQADRIHPTAAAQPRMLDNVWTVLATWLAAPAVADGTRKNKKGR